MQLYHDLLSEIEIWERRIEDLEGELDAALHTVWTGEAPSSPRPVHVPLDKSLRRYDDVKERLQAAEKVLRSKRELLQKIEQQMGLSQALEQKIAYKRYVEGKTLLQIAMEEGKSYDYIRKVHSRMNKAPAS